MQVSTARARSSGGQPFSSKRWAALAGPEKLICVPLTATGSFTAPGAPPRAIFSSSLPAEKAAPS